MTIPSAPALYLEHQYDRALSLRIITRRLTHQLYGTGPHPPTHRQRLKTRLERAQRHLYAIGGTW